jgi:hypothetical protein
MRRVLKARALGQDEGDLSTLEEEQLDNPNLNKQRAWSSSTIKQLQKLDSEQ